MIRLASMLATYLLCFLFSAVSYSQMRVHMINVGQGCATLIEFPCAAILIDAGGESNPLYASPEALKTYLTDFFARRTDLQNTLECVYITHPHKDHTLGVPVILEEPFVIRNVVTDGLERGSGKSGQLKLHRAVQDADGTDAQIGFEAVRTNEIPAAGFSNSVIDAVDCGGVNPLIKILWGNAVNKPAGWSPNVFDNENNHSLVIRVDYGSASILITGDLEDAAQNTIVTKFGSNGLLDADVYVVGHHGSKNGSSESLVNKITPEIALIGVGDPARETNWTAWAYGHPNKGILERLQAKLTGNRVPITILAGTGAKTFVEFTVRKAIYSTAWDDNIVLEADESGNWTKLEDGIVPDLVNINTAGFEELQTIPGIGPVKARAILDFRNSNGPFESIDELDEVTGIGPATLELARPFVRI